MFKKFDPQSKESSASFVGPEKMAIQAPEEEEKPFLPCIFAPSWPHHAGWCYPTSVCIDPFHSISPSLPKTSPGTPRSKALPANLGPGKLKQINHQIPYQPRPSQSLSGTVSSHPFRYYQGLQELRPPGQIRTAHCPISPGNLPQWCAPLGWVPLSCSLLWLQTKMWNQTESSEITEVGTA